MNYLKIIIDLFRMLIAIPLYIVAMVFGGIAAVFEYLADKVDVLNGPNEAGRV